MGSHPQWLPLLFFTHGIRAKHMSQIFNVLQVPVLTYLSDQLLCPDPILTNLPIPPIACKWHHFPSLSLEIKSTLQHSAQSLPPLWNRLTSTLEGVPPIRNLTPKYPPSLTQNTLLCSPPHHLIFELWALCVHCDGIIWSILA